MHIKEGKRIVTDVYGLLTRLDHRLLEALRNATLSREQYDALCTEAIQIRFSSA